LLFSFGKNWQKVVAKQGRASESLVVEAVDPMLSCDWWFVAEVEKGIAAAAVATWLILRKSARWLITVIPPDTAVPTTEIGSFIEFGADPL
jgi:hypothetical protein